MLERLISIEVMSSANRSRKYDSGSQKRKKKQRLDDLTQSQKRAMDRFYCEKITSVFSIGISISP